MVCDCRCSVFSAGWRGHMSETRHPSPSLQQLSSRRRLALCGCGAVVALFGRIRCRRRVDILTVKAEEAASGQ